MNLSETEQRNLPDIYVVVTSFENLAEKIQAYLPDVKVVALSVQSGELSAADVDILNKKAEVVVCELMLFKKNVRVSDMRNLKWIQALSNGVNRISMDLKENPSFCLTRMTWNVALVAEYVITYILVREKRLLEMYEVQKSCQWQQIKFAAKRQLKQLSVCIIGVGKIGMAVAKHCKRFGMFVYGVTRTDKSLERSETVDEYHTLQTLPQVLQLVDYICCCVPGTPETDNMLSGDILSACKSKQPILVNVGRGNLINEETLVRAVKEGWVGGLVLDVLPEEPLSANNELWELPNVTITPHVSGYNRNKKVVDRCISTIVENYKRYCSGKPLINEVNKDTQY